ncbi:MAG: leucine-rich repeat protein [Clostridia bacterium]|nr:leucine-rich repeat protein [Clostridia bacterium]
MSKRILSFVLAALMVFATIPAVAISSTALGNNISGEATFTTGTGADTTMPGWVDISWYDPAVQQTEVPTVPNEWTWELSDEGVLTITGTGVVSGTDGVYPWDDKLASIVKVVVSDGITEIGAGAFNNCENLEEVVLGEGVLRVGGDAFAYNNKLTTMTIPSTIERFSQGTVYSSNNLNKITLTGGLTVLEFYEVVNSSGAYNTAYIEERVSYYYPGETGWDYTLVDGVLTVTGNGPMTEYALEEYPWHEQREAIKKVVIGDQITSVPARSFQGCKNLEEIVFGSSVVKLGQDVFSNCGTVDKVVIPESLRFMGQGVSFNSSVNTVVLNNVTKEEFLALVAQRAYNDALSRDSVNFVWRNFELQIDPYNCGWENWSGDTVMILNIKDKNGTEFAGLRGNEAYTWKLTYSVPNGWSKQITTAPSSGWGTAWCRFTPCLGEGENQFVPASYATGTTNYLVKLEIYEGDELVGASEITEGFNVPAGFEPIVPGYEQGSRLVHNEKCYVQAAFEEPRQIETVTLVNYADTSRYYTWDVYASNDLENWTLLGGKLTTEASDADGYTINIPLNAEGEYNSYRYLRVYGTLGSANVGYHFVDIQITEPEEDMSTVTWVVDGNVEHYKVKNGEIPEYPGTPAKEPTYTKQYTFAGWDKEVVAVTENVTYTAVFEESVRAPREIVVGNYYGTTIENWSGETQLLAVFKNEDGYDMSVLWKNRDNYKFELIFEWKENGEDKVESIVLAPDSCAWANPENTFLRFAICADEENAFVPVIGVSYVLTINVFDLSENGYHYLVGKGESEYKFTDTNAAGEKFVPIHDHVCPEGDEIEVPATTLAPGSNTYICEKCHGEITEEIAQLEKVVGDMDADGRVSITDVTLLLNVIGGTGSIHEELDSDLDDSGDVTINDVTVLLNMIANTPAVE